ncbi:MAG TPA: two-component regulator propeller domain-containing protein, partial [Flavitalea sp.]|nr:two-component regulator propeller domain-containing protein [Flavitalea sp.]
GVEQDKGNNIWAGCLGGVSVLSNNIRQATIGVTEGCPSIYINCIRQAPDGSMWVGTQVGVVRFHPDGTHSLRFSRRWLLDDNVQDIQFNDSGTAYIATPKGVSVIRQLDMTLSSKQEYFYKILMDRHIREPWIAGQVHLRVPGDLSTWQPEDDDNDGEFTGNYLTMESFRYAATKSEDARIKAKKAFKFLKLLEEVTGGDGYFARTIVPVDWKFRMHDTNRVYTKYELAEELVKEPRYKAIEVRWRKSTDGKWLWKGDASSDEWCGHMMGYYFYYELAADAAEKEIVRNHVARLMDHLIANNYNMMDIDGTHTRWSVWSPDNLNRDPEWQPDRFQNSMEILAFLKLAYYMTGKEKYQQHYMKLINQEHYLDNMKNLVNQNPAWFIYYDVTMQAYLFPILMHCERDPALLSTYSTILNAWMDRRRNDHNPLINFLYCYASNKKEELVNSIDFLKDTPLDLVDWNLDHTKREDVKLVRLPVLDDLQVNELPPPSIRTAVRWDKNPWSANNGYPDMEREPVFWLLPYWMGRYLNMIEN